MNKRLAILLILISLVSLLAGCGGAGGTDGAEGSKPVASPTITGVAAAGSPLVGTLFLKDASVPAKEISTLLAADGSYSLDLTGLTPPFLLKAEGTSNGVGRTLYSFAPAAGVANVNPLSHLAVVEASGSDSLAGLYSAPGPVRMQIIKDALPQAVARLRSALQPTLARFGVDGVDFIAGPFVANHQGLDLVLDMADFSVANGTVTIIDKPANRTLQMPRDSFMAGSLDIADVPATTVGSVIPLPGAITVGPDTTAHLSAVVVGATDQGVIWSVQEESGGTVTAGGVYTAPATPGIYHVQATCRADTTKSATVTATVTNTAALKIVESGSGVYTVQATGLSSVAGIDLTIRYDAAILANPQVVKGSLVANALSVSNTAMAGIVRWGSISVKSITGSGVLATITFDRLGNSSGGIRSMTATLVGDSGRLLPVTTSIPAPAGTEAPLPPAQPSSEQSQPPGGGTTTPATPPVLPQIGTTSPQPGTIVSQPVGSGE